MIGILGGMGTQAGLDFCNKLAKLNRGKTDQNYPLFLLYNKSNIPDRKLNLKKYNKVLKSLLDGCKFLERNKCRFVSIPCNTAHYWYEDLKKRTNIPILNMPETVYLNTKKNCKKNSKIGLLATETTIKTGVYSRYFNKNYNLILPPKVIQITSVNRSIKLIKMGKTKEAERALRKAINYMIKINCKKIILGCTELPIAVFAFKSFKKAKQSKLFLDPNLLLAQASMRYYNK
tara:strand:+ start:52 stop:747 length:696 start_codon:yes stop_codon:yes gene_type:complete